jgi:glyoxylase-like metal-dependent hydrolase (beta-lactamase superfamily II)
VSSDLLPAWATLIRADNPSPMTLEGTNTYVLDTGLGTVVVVDPGPLDEVHLAEVADGRAVAFALLTHGHPDHAEGAPRFASIAGCDVYARDPRERVGEQGPELRDGEVLDLGGLSVTVLGTPGHTGDSVSFLVRPAGRPGRGPEPGRPAEPGRPRERGGLLLTGDTILGRGTTVVAHPDGRLGPYLDSLVRLSQLDPVVLGPGHGPVGPDAPAVARDYLRHRAERLEQVRQALAEGDTTAAEVVARVYADVDRSLWPAAELSVRAQLDYLAEQGEGI